MWNYEKIRSPHSELIDTLWNVNIFPYSADDKNSLGINRYIMECKL